MDYKLLYFYPIIQVTNMFEMIPIEELGSISFQNIVEELINNIINTLPSMTQYEYSDKRIGVDDYVLFLNNVDTFIGNLRGKLILVEFVWFKKINLTILF